MFKPVIAPCFVSGPDKVYARCQSVQKTSENTEQSINVDTATLLKATAVPVLIIMPVQEKIKHLLKQRQNSVKTTLNNDQTRLYTVNAKIKK